MDKIRLFCLPYAGGSATVYYKWKKYLNSDIALYPVELAGRGRRARTPLYNNLEEAVEDVFSMIQGEVDEGPYALFGHSLGSILVFETLHRLKETGHGGPVHAFFSGCRPPHLMHKAKVLHTLPDEEFKEEILKMGGTEKEVFENKELSDYFTRLLKSDLKMAETYQYRDKEEKLKTDFTVFSGKKDDLASFEEISEWQQYTSGACRMVEFDGGHFFINSSIDALTRMINRTLTDCAAALRVR